MADMLIMDLSQLEADELQYEERIRAHYEPPNNSLLLSTLGRVSQWMENERVSRTNVVQISHGLTSDQIPTELDSCNHHINVIYDAVTADNAEAGELVDLQHANRHASRLLHYENRIRRLSTAAFSEEQRNIYDTTLRLARLAKAVLTTRIWALADRHLPAIPVGNASVAASADAIAPAAANHGSRTAQTDRNNDNPEEIRSRPLHESTLNNSNAPDLAGLQTPNGTISNVQQEVDQRAQAEISRRSTEYQICRERLGELHEDIQNEYVRPSALNRVSEARQMMGRSIGLAVTLKGILRLTLERNLRTQIEGDIGLLLGDRYILESVLMRAGIGYVIPPEALFLPTAVLPAMPPPPATTPTANGAPAAATASTNGQTTQTRAQSTIFPSYRLFGQGIDELTFNLSHPYTAVDHPIVRNIGHTAQVPSTPAPNAPQVRFAPPTVIPNSSDSGHITQTQPTAGAISAGQPIQNMPHQSYNATPVTQIPQAAVNNHVQGSPYPLPYVRQPHEPPRSESSIGTLGTPVAPTVPIVQANRSYHPAISAARYPAYAPVQVDPNASRAAAAEYMSKLPAMNALQGQQYLAKVLGNRRYAGNVADGTKTIALDEFIGQTRNYQRWTGASDAVVLSQLATFFTGPAFTWWEANSHTITSVDHLEIRLKSRFERVASDEMTTFATFCGRRQEKYEDLLDYIDDMRKKASFCKPFVSEPQIIARIIDNAIDTYRRALASKQYESVSDLVLFAEYLVRSDPKPRFDSSSNQQKSRAQSYSRSRSVNAMETETEPTENEVETAEEEPSMENSAEAMIEALANVFSRWQSSNRPQRPANRTNTSPARVRAGQKNESQTPAERSPFSCYGCGTPGVYQRDCMICQAKNQSKNDSATS